MTHSAISPEHPRWSYAQEFGKQLHAALLKRKMRPFHLYRAAGGGWSAYQFHLWLDGQAIPRLDRAIKLAEILDWPALSEIVRAARTGTCERPGCGRSFITEGGRTRKYCSARCRQLVHDYDLRYTHATRKKVASGDQLEHEALAYIAAQNAQRQELDEHRTAVAGMCNSCEPEGYCRTPTCPLRSVSPLPVIRHDIVDPHLSRMGARRWSTLPALPKAASV